MSKVFTATTDVHGDYPVVSINVKPTCGAARYLSGQR